MKSVEMNMLDL